MSSAAGRVELKLAELFTQSFRPFFFFGSLYAAITVFIWVPAFEGRHEILSIFDPVDWHIHEMLFGYLPAVMTGFLLTAVPNWTDRSPITGRPLLLLLLMWASGRLAVMLSNLIGPYATMMIDCSYLLVLSIVVGREIVIGRNWRNLKILVPLAGLLAANLLFHHQVNLGEDTDLARRLALGAAVFLMILIGGRIIPNFTRNWLKKENPGRQPKPFGLFDGIGVFVAFGALIAWIAFPKDYLTGHAMLLAGALALLRMARWAGDRTIQNPLVLFLHIAFLFVPVGLLLIGVAVISDQSLPSVAGIHAFGAGAIGAMTLSIMMRATLGHTNRPLVAGSGEQIIFACVVFAAVLRILGSSDLDISAQLIRLSGGIWAASFVGFAVLIMPRVFSPSIKSGGRNGELS